jgi:SAM-dependent methyltransferase
MAFFDVFAKDKGTYFGNLIENKTKFKEFKYISRFLKHRSIDILEIGPGQGKLANIFIKNGFTNYDVVEPNDLMRSNLISLGVRSAKNYCIPKLNEADETYDLIIITDVFEHLNDFKEGDFFITEAHRVLRKSGKLFVLSPDYIDWRKDFWNCDPSHNLVTTLRRLKMLYRDHNFKILSYKYTYAFLDGIIGYVIGKFVKLITCRSTGNSLESKIYKLRLTFLRRFSIIGKKRSKDV